MTFREWNNRRNNYLREQKGKWAAKLLGCAPRSDAYNPQKVQKILLLRNDNKLGDALVSSVLLRGLKALFPTADIDVVAGKSNALILRNNPAVSTLYFATEGLASLISCGLKLRDKQYDLYLDLDEKPTLASLTFLKVLQPRWAFGFNREKYPLYNLTQSLDLSAVILRHGMNRVCAIWVIRARLIRRMKYKCRKQQKRRPSVFCPPCHAAGG